MKNYSSIFLMTSLLILVSCMNSTSCMDPTSSEDDKMTGPDSVAEAMRLAEYLEIIQPRILANFRNAVNYGPSLRLSHEITLNLKRDLSSLVLMDNKGSFVFDKILDVQLGGESLFTAGGNYIGAKSSLFVFREAKMDSSDTDTNFSIEKVILEFKDDNGDVTREEFDINQRF